MTPDEAGSFYEEDEDPAVMFAAYDEAVKAYSALAVSETPADAEEHRRILRRRRPAWTGEG